MKSFADGKIDVYLGPVELGAADNLEQAIVDFIGGARKSLDIAVQEIDSIPIAEAIINARWNGVSVNVFVEQDYIRTKLEKVPEPPEPDAASGETQAEAIYRLQWRSDQETAAEDLERKRETLAINRVILSALLRNGIEVKGDFNPKIFHQKFIVRDYRGKAQPRSALLTGSANFTHHDTHDNLNNVFVFHDALVCREYANEFARLSLGQFGRGLLGDVPKTIDVNGVPVKIAFAPDHAPELELMKQLLTVRADGLQAELEGGQIWFAIFTFNGSSGIDDTLLALARGGVKIRGVLDRGQARQKWALPPWLKHDNLELRVPPKPGRWASRFARCTTRRPSSTTAPSSRAASTTRDRQTTSTTRTSSSSDLPTTRSKNRDGRRSRLTRPAVESSPSTSARSSNGSSRSPRSSRRVAELAYSGS
jgi:hypothetical protein